MNRTLKEAAHVLGIGEKALRTHLRQSGVLNADNTLAARHHSGGNLLMDPRATRTPTGIRKHYAVLMVTEAGIDWLAKRLGIDITEMPQRETA